ncbi:uncharacterized protein LOC130722004 [Lotus japonicus]|uniref:uncharacterized protein LOC130722004 n=1 Tax=Lotus japonicus TaxID=34305 RepID=UPI00258BAA5F|nr:uncharacterized protein LOC130722004 [Lotus japonicus]
MDPSENPFDLATYVQNCEIEETYILNRFRERRNKILEDRAPRSRKYLSRDHLCDPNVHHELQADLVKHI